MSRTTRPPQHGFTLLELLVVLLIIGLMIAVVPPLFSGALPGTKLKGAARDLAASLNHARSQAITRNAVVSVHLNTDTPPQYRIDDGRITTLPADISLRVSRTSDRTGLEAARQAVQFFPDGSASDTRITLSVSDRGYRLDVNWLTGRVRIGEMDIAAL